MAFSGVELEEVAPSSLPTYGVTIGSKIVIVSPGEYTVFDSDAEESLLYASGPGSGLIPPSISNSNVIYGAARDLSYPNKYAEACKIDLSTNTRTVIFSRTSNLRVCSDLCASDTYLFGIFTTNDYGQYSNMRKIAISSPSGLYSEPNMFPDWIDNTYNNLLMTTVGDRLFLQTKNSTGRSSDIKEINPTDASIINSISVPGSYTTPYRGVVYDGYLWWRLASTTTIALGINLSSGAIRYVQPTPGGISSSGGQPVIHDNVMYWVASDNTKVYALDLSSGRWKLDDLPTTRSGRQALAVGNNKLWIPSTVTP